MKERRTLAAALQIATADDSSEILVTIIIVITLGREKFECL